LLAATDDQTLAPLPTPRHAFTISCHRGDHTHVPENTLKAYENAIKAGADYVEIDLRTTVDSQLVIMHDATVNRMTTGIGAIKDLRYDSLSKLKVKDKTHPEWGEHPIPTFSQVLELCKDKIYIYLDFKNADPALPTGSSRSMGCKNKSSFISTQNSSSTTGAAWLRPCRSWSACPPA
jgi:glycerophosphoryl diester phosphodiesterase